MICPLLVALVSIAQPSTAGDLYVVSCIEQGMMRPPCIVYILRAAEGTIEEVLSIPGAGGIRMVKLCSKERKLAVWNYAQTDYKGPPVEEGKLTVADLQEPIKSREFIIPFKPIFGGYFYRLKDDSLAIVTEKGGPEKKALLLRSLLSENESVEVNECDIHWERVLSDGGNSWARSRNWPVLVHIDVTTGKFSRVKGYSVCPLEFGFDETALAAYRDITKNGALAWQPSEKLIYNGSVAIKTDDQLLAKCFLQNENESDGARNLMYAAYDMKKGIWTFFPKPLAFGYASALGDWFVFQEMQEGELHGTVRQEPVPTGRFLFVDYVGKIHNEWRTDPETEPLLIQEGSILFRRLDAIYEATFKNGRVGDERLLHRDERLRDVHWVLPVTDK